MDFTEPVRDEQVDIEIEPVTAAPEPNLNQRLHLLKTVVSKQNQRMAEAYVRIAAEIERIREHLPASKLKTFLVSECGLNRSDLNMYMRFAEALGQHEETITRRDCR